MWLGFVAWLPLADSTAGEIAVGELPLAVCLMGDKLRVVHCAPLYMLYIDDT